MPDQSPFGGLKGPVLVSACLLGVKCRYDGTSQDAGPLLDVPGVSLVPVCPEQLGGLPTPRPRAHLVGGDGHAVLQGRALVEDEHGREVTPAFVRGAGQVCLLAEKLHARYAVLKERSPSCGTHVVWVEGSVCGGRGVTAAMLEARGVCVMNEQGLKA